MIPPGPGTGAPSGSPCAECGAPLATDQTYCVQCGARRGPLPARVAVALADIEDHGRPIAPDDPVLDEDLSLRMSLRISSRRLAPGSSACW